MVNEFERREWLKRSKEYDKYFKNECLRCGHTWVAKPKLDKGKVKIGYPIVCPKCKSPYWDMPKK